MSQESNNVAFEEASEETMNWITCNCLCDAISGTWRSC